jgi:large subunit ribosomal protein L17
MRHGDKVNNLGRTAAHRRAMLANMAISLITHKRITTTLAKAKALRRYAEPLLTKSKDNTTHSRRVVFSYLQNKEAVAELFGAVATKIADRPGGYLRVIKLGFRRGDGADMALIELVDFNEVYNPKGEKADNKKKTRRGRRTSKAATTAAAAVAAAPVVAAAVVEEEVMPVVEEVVETPAQVVEEVATVAEEVTAAADEATTDETPAADEKSSEEETAA